MRRILGAALAALISLPLLAIAAIAADKGGPLPRIAAPAQAQVSDEGPAWNRSGFYVGALAGYDLAKMEAAGLSAANGEIEGTLLGGVNYRAGGLVYGLEADITLTNISASSTNGLITVTSSADYIATLRGRLGVPIGPALIYATAGPAFKHATLDVNGVQSKEWQVGLVAGGGAELEISRSFAVRLEALYFKMPDQNVGLLESQNDHTVVRAGAIFKLN